MRKAFVLIYSDAAGTREDVTKWADDCSLVITWRWDLPNCLYLISDYSAQNLAENFRLVSSKARSLVIEISADAYWGFLPSETWYLLENKRHKPK